MYESNEEVIETLIRIAADHMDSSATCAEGWLEETLENEGLTAWGTFKETRFLDEFESAEDLTDQYERYEADWLSEVWESDEIEQAVANEVDTVWCWLTDYMDTEDKFVAIQKLV